MRGCWGKGARTTKGGGVYLGWLVDGLHQDIAPLLHAAVQQGPPFDGEGQRAVDVLLESVGGMPLKRHGRAVRRLLPDLGTQNSVGG